MAAPEAAIQQARVGANDSFLRSQTRARWVAGSSPAMVMVAMTAFNYSAASR
jgi:hypothetical protein